jgi:hypothetical protein
MKMGNPDKRIRLCIMGPITPERLAFFCPDGNYQKTITNFTTRIKTEKFSVVFSDKYIGSGLLNLITSFRIEVQKNYKEDSIIPCQVSPQYSQLGDFQKKEKAVEVDISKAYLTAAFKIGAICESTYDRLSSVSKQTRLMVVGSLGTRKTVAKFEDGKQISSEVVQDQNLYEVWKWIVAEVDKTMREVAQVLKGGFLYYWCDAAFVKVSHVAEAQKAMADRGYGSKSRMVTMRRDGAKVYILDGRKFPIGYSAPTPKPSPALSG